MKIGCLTLCVAVLLATTSVHPQQNTAGRDGRGDAGVPQDAALSALRGIVVADADGTPLRRVRVALSAAGVAADPVFTDDDGRFELLVPAATAYAIAFSKPGFARRALSARGSAQDLVTVRLARGAAITGTVLDEFGDPVLSRVRVAGPDGERTVDTDPLGEFRVGSLAAGQYEVVVMGGGGPLNVDAASRAAVDLAAGDEAVVALRNAGPRFDLRAPAPVSPNSSDAAPARSAGAGVIRGIVVASSGAPVGGAAVGLGVEGAATRSATTDATGRFEFPALPAAVYSLGATKFGPTFLSTARARVPLRDGEVLDDVTLVMQRPGSIAGTVRDEFGEPVEGIVVELWQPRTGAGRSLLLPAAFLPAVVRTDDRGRYRMAAAPGPSYVVASAAPASGDHAERVGRDALRIYYPGTTAVAEAVTVDGRTGVDLDGIDILYATGIPGQLRGFAFDAAGRPLSEPVAFSESFRSGSPVPAPRSATVGPDGSFAFTAVPAGEYVLHAMVRGVGGSASELAVQYVTVSESEVPPVVVRTSPGTTLSGRIVLEGEAPGSAQQFQLSVQTADWDYLPLGRELPRAVVQDDGAFLLPGLYGPLHMTASPPPGWWLKSVNIGAVDAAHQPFVFGAVPRIENVTAVFADTAAELTGRVRDGDRPAAQYSVLVFSVDRTRWWAPSGYARLARPDAQGIFTALSLAPGDYLAAAVDRFDINTDWLDPDLLAELEPRARRVTLPERGRVNIELELITRAP